jgi:hypothetical protein
MKTTRLARENTIAAKRRWGSDLSHALLDSLRDLSDQHGFSIKHGDIMLLDSAWYVTHTGLIRLARRHKCSGIHVHPAREFCEPSHAKWAFEATVYTSLACRGFYGYGDAEPSNVSSVVRGAEMRVAETRAVSRALRKAYGIGICSVEELVAFSCPLPPAGHLKKPAAQAEAVNGNGNHPLRDRLYLLIRQYRLDPALVKAYAADYCNVTELRQASRDQVAGFIKYLAEYAQSDREGLLCQLNSYGPKPPAEALVQITPAETGGDTEKVEGAA